MSPALSISDLLHRLRARDEGAVEEIMQRYGPAIRAVIRVRGTQPALERYFDSSEIFNSMLGSFVANAVQGKFPDLETPEDLGRLLRRLARNKFIDYVRRFLSEGRDHRRVHRGGDNAFDWVASGMDPAEAAANRELLEQIRQRLSIEERHLFDMRVEGYQWAEIAEECALGSKPDALRMRLFRAIRLILDQLGLDDDL